MVLSMLKNERGKQILQQLLRDGEVTVLQLAERLKTSTTTVRRELTDLEGAGLLRRTHGGAFRSNPCCTNRSATFPLLGSQEQFHADEKRRIGLAAADMMKDGETIATGAGTTTTHVGRAFGHRKGITVVTNALNIAMELSHRARSENHRYWWLHEQRLVCADWILWELPQLASMFYDKAFIGVDGIHPDHGLTTNCPDQGFQCIGL